MKAQKKILRRSRPLATAIGLGVVMLLAAPVPAAASTWYAAPAGAGTDCTQASPCPLKDAVETKAATGDEVIVTPGSYSLDAKLTVDDDITVRGVSAAERPSITIDPGVGADGLLLNSFAGGATLQDLKITSLGSGTALLILPTNVTAERLYVEQGDGLATCNLARSGVLRDSVCSSTSLTGAAVASQLGGAGTFTYRIVNLTAVATGGPGVLLSAAGGANLTANATNVIASGNPADVRVETGAAGDGAVVNLDYSNYDTISATNTSGATEGITIPGSGTNQTALPVFAPGPGNFHQAANSPTIDAGATNPLNGGMLDLDGEARAQGVAQDIGADEFTVVPPAIGQQLSPGLAGLLSRSARAKGSMVPMLFACPTGGGNCDGNQVVLQTARPIVLKRPASSAKQRKRKRITLGGTSFSIPAGRTLTVQVPLTKRARKLLRLRGKLAASVTITGGGASSTAPLGIRPQGKRKRQG